MNHIVLSLFLCIVSFFQKFDHSNFHKFSSSLNSSSSTPFSSLFLSKSDSFFSLISYYRVESRKNFTSITEAEKINSYDCRQQIRKLSHNLRLLLEKLVSQSVPGIWQKIFVLRHFYPYIDTLEREALNCCHQGQSLDICTASLIEHLNYWELEGTPKDMK